MRPLMILDDDAEVVALFERFAKKAGIAATGFTQTSDFMEELARAEVRPDVLLDLNMPEIDGIGVIEKLQGRGFDGRVYLTSGAGLPVLEAARKVLKRPGLEICGLLQKPFTFDDFRTLLSSDEPHEVEDKNVPLASPSPQVSDADFADIETDFSLHYQPKVWAEPRKLAGFEALARFRTKDGHVLPTEDCIAKIRDAHRMEPFTERVIEQSFTWAGKNLGADHHIALNVEPQFFSRPDIFAHIEDLRRAHSLSASQIVFEVTEHVGMPSGNAVLRTFTQLRVAGYGIAIDDFGIGFSSLKQLSDFPFSEIKIDGTFVERMESETGAAEIVRAVVRLAKASNIICTAERVETETAAVTLTEVGCDFLQGYWIGRPVPENEAAAIVAAALQKELADDSDSAGPMKVLGRDGVFAAPTVAIVDDESGVRQTLVRGLERHGFDCRPYRGGADFLESLEYHLPDCVVLDMRMPEMDGASVLSSLPPEAKGIPVIVLSSHGEIGIAVSVMAQGAADFLEKPISIKTLAGKIERHIAASLQRREAALTLTRNRERLSQLTPRERKVGAAIAAGLSNKEIAQDLGISYRTVENHRANILKKLDARNAVDIALIYEKSGTREI